MTGTPTPRRGLGADHLSSGPEPTAAATPTPRRGLTPHPASPGADAPASAGTDPAASSTAESAAPRPLRRWFLTAGVLLLAAAALVIVARALVVLPAVQEFVVEHPGVVDVPATATGFPAWVSWQHALNVFFLVLIVRTGWQVRTQKRPPATWTPRGRSRPKISLTLWLHLALDALWLANGVLFVVLLVASGRWQRVVPTSWEIVPNALSAALQYASLDWPTENGWFGYNSLQVLVYFVTIFIAAPLAALTGIRMSPLWPSNPKLARVYPIEWARAAHFPVMLYFVLFTIVHLTLVLATGALRNLNHMYAGRDVTDAVGALVFGGSLLVIAAAWVAARPVVIGPIAALTGTVASR